MILTDNCGTEGQLLEQEAETSLGCLTHIDANICSIDFTYYILLYFIMIIYILYLTTYIKEFRESLRGKATDVHMMSVICQGLHWVIYIYSHH